MRQPVRKELNASRRPSQRGTQESPFARRLLIALALAFCLVFLLLPLANVFAQALAQGWSCCRDSVTHPDSLAAIRLTLLVAGITVPLNVVFGLAAAWAIAKFNFPGKSILITVIDLPFSVSPVVAGLMFVVLFGLQGFFGQWLDAHDMKIIFAVPGIVLATLFVTFPFVARELIPAIPFSELPSTMERLFSAYDQHRTTDESFLDFSRRHSIAELQSFCAAKEQI